MAKSTARRYFFQSPEQHDAALLSKDKLENSGLFDNVFVTEITPATTYYIAEDNHLQYLEKGGLAACHIPG